MYPCTEKHPGFQAFYIWNNETLFSLIMKKDCVLNAAIQNTTSTITLTYHLDILLSIPMDCFLTSIAVVSPVLS